MQRSDEQFEKIACQICGKPSGLSPTECHNSLGQQSTLCRAYGRCRIDEKTESQCDYVLFPRDKNVFLKACPGSGKTEVVGLKAAYEMSRWNNHVGGIAVLTFTNNAADVIKKRVLQFAGADKVGYPHYVGTIDSWLHGFLANPFGHIVTGHSGDEDGNKSLRIIDSDCRSNFLHSFETKYKYAGSGNVQAHHYYIDIPSANICFASGDQKLDSPRNKLTLVQWQVNDLTDTKHRFWSRGFATYQDVEYICHRLCSKNSELVNLVATRFPFIVVDECQDLSEAQLSILQSLLTAGSVIHIVGDLDQAIYSFKKVDPRSVERFAQSNGFGELRLPHNFRSHMKIVDLCSKLRPQQAVAVNGNSVDGPVCVYFSYQAASPASVVTNFIDYIKMRGMNADKSAVLARGHANISRLHPGKTSKELTGIKKAAMAVFLWKTSRADCMDEALRCMGSFLSTKAFSGLQWGQQRYYCPHCIPSPLHWRLFVSRLLDACVRNETLAGFDNKWSDWAAEFRSRGKQIIGDCWSELFDEALPDLKLIANAPSNEGTQPVSDCVKEITVKNATLPIRITTIHQVKGETLDSVLLVLRISE